VVDGSIYTPGAGTLPPVLAGRDGVLHSLSLGLHEVATVGRGRARDVILIGPRGVGKTVTLTTYGVMAAAAGFEVINLQAVAGRSGLVASLLQRASSRVAAQAGPWTRAKRAFDRLASISVGVAGVSAGTSTHPGQAQDDVVDPGTLAEALVELATEVRRDTPNGGLLLTVDEMQVASHSDLALLAATLHRLDVDHPGTSVVFAGTGLPHTTEVLRTAGVTHPDRLFLVEQLPVTLADDDAAYAIIEPARRSGVAWRPDAATAIVRASGGYPAHLQQFAHTVWTAAVGPHVITVEDVRRALPLVEADLDRRTLGPRWDRMTDRQMEYLAALSVHGGRATTRALAATLGRTPQELSWIREDLIREGDIYAPQRGHVTLTVPIFVPFVLAHYEEARATSDTELLALSSLQQSAARAVAPRQLPASPPSVARAQAGDRTGDPGRT
jgi:hypothetical protein